MMPRFCLRSCCEEDWLWEALGSGREVVGSGGKAKGSTGKVVGKHREALGSGVKSE